MTGPAAPRPGPTVERVVGERQLTEFLDLPTRLHGRDHFVPPLHPTIRSWYAGTHAAAHHGPVELLLARDDRGQVVGRACCHHDPHFEATLGHTAQLFGLTEFADAAALAALTAYVDRRARQTGRRSIVGPVSLLPNQTGGVITSGFAERGFVDSPWNPPHYPADYRALGFERIFPGSTWICEDLPSLDPARTHPFDDERIEAEGLVVHHGSPWRWRSQVLPVIRSLLNESFAALDYYTPIEAIAMREQSAGLEFILDRRLVLWLTRRGEPVAFVLVVPDVSAFVMARGGRLNLRDQAALVATRHRYRKDAILIIKGTSPDAQGNGYQSLLSRELLRGLQQGGYRTLRSTFVGADNPGSAAQYVRMGGRPLHGTTFYRRAVR